MQDVDDVRVLDWIYPGIFPSCEPGDSPDWHGTMVVSKIAGRYLGVIKYVDIVPVVKNGWGNIKSMGSLLDGLVQIFDHAMQTPAESRHPALINYSGGMYVDLSGSRGKDWQKFASFILKKYEGANLTLVAAAGNNRVSVSPMTNQLNFSRVCGGRG